VSARVDVLIQPFCLRFSLHEDEIVYLVAGAADMQLDRMELLMGVDPASATLFDANVGFLPVATTALIRSRRTIVVDPGNHHVGFYGMLHRALARFGLAPRDVDVVVCTHSHHDHMASLSAFPGAELVIGAGELEFARSVYGAATVDAAVGGMGAVTEVEGELEIDPGVVAVATPGHTPGHISVLATAGEEHVAVAGDVAMTRAEYEDLRFSHWYTPEQVEELTASVRRLRAFAPTLVLPGHDRGFRP
jgi:N-acyl homoserine lactone hydrolase